jgi:hypothetical protein
MSEAYPWERLPDEPNRWFGRFERYRLMGPGRSIQGACNRERVGKGRKESADAPGSWRNASKSWHWIERAEAWDQYLVDEAAAAVEAKWAADVMGPTEVLSRLSTEGRVNIGDFLTTKRVPLRDKKGFLRDADGNVMFEETWDISLAMVHSHGHLVKSITATQYGPRIELYDGQAALVQMGKHHKLFVDVQEQNGEIHHVEMTLAEWKEQQQKNRQAAGAVLAQFGEEIEDA